MTDRELLELAAKAAGIKGKYDDWWEMGDQHCVGIRAGGWGAWNPLTDDGDRYRLAKKLDIRIHFGPSYVSYEAGGICGVISWPEDAKDDAYAIVRAAAEIGKAMP